MTSNSAAECLPLAILDLPYAARGEGGGARYRTSILLDRRPGSQRPRAFVPHARNVSGTARTVPRQRDYASAARWSSRLQGRGGLYPPRKLIRPVASEARYATAGSESDAYAEVRRSSAE